MRKLLVLHFTARPFLPYYLVYDDRMGLIYQNWKYRARMAPCGNAHNYVENWRKLTKLAPPH